MHLVTNALVIRAADYKESDKILTVLTDTRGLMTVKARGVRRKSSKNTPAAQLFAYSSMTLFEQSGRYTLDEAETLEQFAGVRSDLGKMALASYFAEVLGTEAEDNRIEPDVLRLALNCLYALALPDAELEKLKAAFELRYAALAGYEPDLSRCDACRTRGGNALCEACRVSGLRNDGAAIGAVRYIAACDLRRLLKFSLTDEALSSLSVFAEHYLLACLERGFKTLEFYRAVC